MNTPYTPYTRFTHSELLNDFGNVTDYYPEEEVTPIMTRLWNECATSWADEVLTAEVAGLSGDIEGAQLALQRASRIERQLGDDPLTRCIVSLFCLAGFSL